MKGFKKTGNGPKMGHSFSAKHGFTHSGTNKQIVKSYTRGVPKVAAKTKFASGGMVTAPMASGDSSVIKRTKPVTGFDAEHGGKGSLRPGFNKGGKACFAAGGVSMRPRNAGPIKSPRPMSPQPASPVLTAPPAAAASPRSGNHGFGNFSRQPLFR